MKTLPLWTLAIFAAAAFAVPAWAQPDLTGNWQGTLQAGRDLRTVVKISKAGDDDQPFLQHRSGGGAPGERRDGARRNGRFAVLGRPSE